MFERKLPAKRNGDGSFSVSYRIGELVNDYFVDFYNEQAGTGFQRDESSRQSRGRQVAEYIRRCARDEVEPKLFELTANARVGKPWCECESICTCSGWSYEHLADNETLVSLSLYPNKEKSWLSLTDGGTRALGLEIAFNRGDLDEERTIDVRIFPNLTLAQEICQFLLINENQKKVRTDLGLRVVQRALDDGNLSKDEMKALQTVVPDTEAWRFAASRIASEMNTANDSPWKNRIQMPSDPPRSTTLQSFFTSLGPILNDKDIQGMVDQMVKDGQLPTDITESLNQILKNFWNAVALVNSRANDEPETNVLWAPIGSSACHIALAGILKTILDSSTADLTTENFKTMMEGSVIEDYDFWYTKKGKKQDDTYPREKGEATVMTGAANYKRLGKQLEQEWRSNLHSNNSKKKVLL